MRCPACKILIDAQELERQMKVCCNRTQNVSGATSVNSESMERLVKENKLVELVGALRGPSTVESFSGDP